MRADPKDDQEPNDHDSIALARDGAQTVGEPSPERLLTALLANARHELRSPLQSIQGFAELLSSEAYGALGEEQHAFVQHILQGTLELSTMLEATLELSELELLTPPTELSLVELRSTVSDALEHVRRESQVSLQLQLGRAAPQARARLDVDALKRAFTAVVKALSTSTKRSFHVELELRVEHAELRVRTMSASADARLLSLSELAEERPAARSLVWLRLAALLLERQGGSLRVSELVDQVEVSLRLWPTH